MPNMTLVQINDKFNADGLDRILLTSFNQFKTGGAAFHGRPNTKVSKQQFVVELVAANPARIAADITLQEFLTVIGAARRQELA